MEKHIHNLFLLNTLHLMCNIKNIWLAKNYYDSYCGLELGYI